MQNIRRTGCTVFLFLAANLPFFDYFVQVGFRQKPMLVLVPVVCFLILNIFPVWGNGRIPSKRLRICAGGCELLICFLSSSVLSGVVLLSMLPVVFGENKLLWAADFVCVVCTEAVVFWNGILRVYLTSAQIGFKWRVIGIVCGWIPVVHIAVLVKIIRMASEEWRFEGGKLLKAQERADERLCATRYPLLLVHGVFFRDFEHFNYWGRIPRELEQNGASVFYGNHQSAASVADSGRELADRIQEIIKDTGCGKVNVIAHSKGGLDTRYAVSCLGMSRYVASLTTINTPHRGCVFADYLLNKLPAAVKDKVAGAYNTALKKMGDEQPDFIAAVTDLTA